MRKLVAISLCCLTLSGCNVFLGDQGYFRNRAKDYKVSALTPVIKVPDDLDRPRFSDEYPVPNNIPTEDTTIALEPPFFNDVNPETKSEA